MIEPLSGYVLIEPIEEDNKTSSGLYVPDNAKEKPKKGRLLKIGKPRLTDLGTDPLGAKEKDIVYYRQWAGEDIKADGKDLKIVKYEDVIARYAQSNQV